MVTNLYIMYRKNLNKSPQPQKYVHHNKQNKEIHKLKRKQRNKTNKYKNDILEIILLFYTR